eukprot:2717804-Prorocentrum_lima.AAC.1
MNDTPFDNLGSATSEQQQAFTAPMVMRSEEEVALNFGGQDATKQGKCFCILEEEGHDESGHWTLSRGHDTWGPYYWYWHS